MATNQFCIDLKGQTAEEASYHWDVDDAFFAEAGGAEMRRGSVDLSLQVRRATAETYELAFRFRGEVEVLCDRCLEPIRLPIEGESELTVRLGHSDDDEPEADRDGTVDLAWSVYEMLALQVPLRHVHKEGECRGETAEALSHYITNDEEDNR